MREFKRNYASTTTGARTSTTFDDIDAAAKVDDAFAGRARR
jgi:hypothetical protein